MTGKIIKKSKWIGDKRVVVVAVNDEFLVCWQGRKGAPQMVDATTDKMAAMRMFGTLSK